MKTQTIQTSKRALLIVLLSALTVCPGLLWAAISAAQQTVTEPASLALAQEDDSRDGPAEDQEPATEAVGERQEREQERLATEREREQEKQERERERQERERERADRAYEKGTRALDRRQWEEAIKGFEEVIGKGGYRMEGAHYWKAYAQNKQGQRERALATLAELAKAFPKSRWLNDAKKLEVEIRQAEGQPVNPESETDEELKVMALNGLMQADPEKALPLLQKLLESSQSRRIKEEALFVLSQSRSAKAREILSDFARGRGNPDVQLKALESLALYGGKESRQVLAEAYASSDDRQVKRAILDWHMIAKDKEHLLAAAKEEKVAELRKAAVELLGILKAQDELGDLYQAETEVEVKKKILEAMFIGGNAERLIALARQEKEPALRGEAVELLGTMEAEKAGAGLVALYGKEQDKEIRKKILDALYAQGNAKALVDIARKEADPGLKKKLVEDLSAMKSKEAAEFFMELLNK